MISRAGFVEQRSTFWMTSRACRLSRCCKLFNSMPCLHRSRVRLLTWPRLVCECTKSVTEFDLDSASSSLGLYYCWQLSHFGACCRLTAIIGTVITTRQRCAACPANYEFYVAIFECFHLLAKPNAIVYCFELGRFQAIDAVHCLINFLESQWVACSVFFSQRCLKLMGCNRYCRVPWGRRSCLDRKTLSRPTWF